jgi:photosystem II stability/assembly factor-like uncharacterized protein
MKKPYNAFTSLLLLLLFSLSYQPSSAQVEPASDPGTIYFPIFNQAAVLKAIGPFGGSVTALTVHPRHPNIYYAGTYGGGVYRSVDHGRSWTSASAGLSNPYVLSLAIDPFDPNKLYAGTYLNGVFKTNNAGQSWQPTGSGLNEDAIVYTLAVDPKTPTILYAGTRKGGTLGGGGVFQSTDGGQSWIEKNSGLKELYVYDLAIDPFEPHVLYAATHAMGVFKSFNGGDEWSSASIGVIDQSARTLVIDPNRNYHTFLGTWHGDSIYKSNDYGRYWFKSNNGISPAKVYSLAFDPANTDMLYASTYFEGVYRSEDAGASWARAGLFDNFVYSVVVDPIYHTVLAGLMDRGIYRSDNQGKDWASSQSGLSATTITALSQASTSSPLYVGTYGNGLFSSRDNGANWNMLSAGLDDRFINTILQSPGNPNIIYVGTQSGGIYKSVDGGLNWFKASAGLPAASISGSTVLHAGALPYTPAIPEDELFREFESQAGDFIAAEIEDIGVAITSLAADPNHPATLYLGAVNGIYKSDNGGASWSASGLEEKPIHYVAVDPFQPHVIFAATNGAAGSLFKSSNAGGTWIQADTGLSGIGLYSLWPDPSRGNVIYAATEKGVYKSENGGTIWAPSGLNGQVVYTVSGSPTNSSALFAGTASGIYKSNNNGRQWVVGDQRLSGKIVRSILAHPSAAQTVFVGTSHFSLYVWSQFQP